MSNSKILSVLTTKAYSEPSVFLPGNLLREARRQKNISDCDIPKVCVLDPDGDILDYLKRTDRATLNSCWPGYHTEMYQFSEGGTEIGIIGRAVGASFAVLLAEQMFELGCELLISITSAGIINQPREDTRFVLIQEALRDEGTSYHYLPPKKPSLLAPDLSTALKPLVHHPEMRVAKGKSWTTDAPYRETEQAIEQAKQEDVTAVEMEAAALYAFAHAQKQPVVCFAHLTNTMAQQGKDFEKGAENGSLASLKVIYETISNFSFDNR